MTVPELAGYTVGVTGARRADEFGALLSRQGARVLHAPALRIVSLPEDDLLLRATENVLSAPVDVVIATTGIGFRGWVEAAEGWGLAGELLGRLACARILCRGAKASGAVRAVGLTESWASRAETSTDLLRALLECGVDGQRIALQLHGKPADAFVDALRDAGAEVVPIPVYRWELPEDLLPAQRLIDTMLAGGLDALAFTSAAAASSLMEIAERSNRAQGLIASMRSELLVACVGSITAEPLRDKGIPVVIAQRARIGGLARSLAETLPARARTFHFGSRSLELRGSAVVLDGELLAIPPAPMAVLQALAQRPGHVVARSTLLAALPSAGEEHAVESTVGRLRAALGERRLVQTVVKRGYRLAVEPR
jgi:uroporphyrinogen-III synthase